jgi:ABC-type spermidine/putrescine transport system permease subunit II
MDGKEVRLVEAAVKLGASYNQILRLVMLGQLKGGRRDGRWFVNAADVERLRAERARQQ